MGPAPEQPSLQSDDNQSALQVRPSGFVMDAIEGCPVIAIEQPATQTLIADTGTLLGLAHVVS